jgi:M3 family oligoendopeptidase
MIRFHEIASTAPNMEMVSMRYAEFQASILAAADADACIEVIREWDAFLREIDSWQALVRLRFNQDTANEGYKKALDECDKLSPKLTDLAVQLKRTILAGPYGEGIAGDLGTTAPALWQAHVTTYDPAIEKDVVSELKCEAEYVELTASASIPVRGESHTLSEIVKFNQVSDRELRHEARSATWNWFADNGTELDRIYDELVRLRTGMSKKLGFEDFVELGYRRMCRIDYRREDVEGFRTAVREHVVPLASELRAKQAGKLSLEHLYEWDLALQDPRGNPKPLGDHDWMLDRAQEMFDQMGGEFGSFFRMMRDSQLLDLKSREGKAGGGFCTAFPNHGVPYIFANFNGTKGDVEVFTHEMGHAFQMFQSRHLPLRDYLWPTMESCEIHSMSLEFLTWPYMDKFFGEEAERFRRIHLAESLLFLPYGVAVDHFQHLVYENSGADPVERHRMWLEMERMYLPDRDYGDMEYPARGGRWQLQAHIYLDPFYYIDYALAQTCALQFWERSQVDYDQALADYNTMCRRGGELPFRKLVAETGLQSPFDSGCLEDVVRRARNALDLKS